MKSEMKQTIQYGVSLILPLIVFVATMLILCTYVSGVDAPITYNRFCAYMAFSLLLSIALCIFLLTRAHKKVIKPIQNLMEATEEFSNGNMHFLFEYEETGTIGKLSKSIDDLRTRIKDDIAEATLWDKESRELISNISHDLKTPITSIKGYVEGLLDNVVEGNPEKREKYLKTIYNKANDMDKLIDELTLYSRIGSNKATYTFRNINAKEYFEDCTDELRTELDAKNIYFEVEDDLNPDTLIVADPEYLKRVVNNIISNSVKNMPSTDGRIVFTMTEEVKYVRIDITDNGNGIPAKDIPHIFDRFYRGDSSRNTAQGGSGIGLSIVKKVVEEHGGKIWVTSAVGCGTTMSFFLKKA